jgi:hypothetical protein
MQVIEVKSPQTEREFLDFPKELYKDDPFWVCPLDTELNAIFDAQKNYLFRRGEAVRWIIKDDEQNTIGRIAAFFESQRSAAYSRPTGGIGFFEVIDNREAAFLLFDTGRNWLASYGMEAMDGPVNFGENDNNWGLLQRDLCSRFWILPYNKKYYRAF